MRISDWSSDVCSSDLIARAAVDIGGMAAAIIFVMDHARAPRHRADRRVDADFILVEIQIVDVVEVEPQIEGAHIEVVDIGLHADEEIGFNRPAPATLGQAETPYTALDSESPRNTDLD